MSREGGPSSQKILSNLFYHLVLFPHRKFLKILIYKVNDGLIFAWAMVDGGGR